MKSVQKAFLLALVALCLSSCLGNESSRREETDEKFLLDLVWNCTNSDDMGFCLKTKALNFLDKIVKMKEPLPITEYMTLAKDPKMSDLDQDINDPDSSIELNSIENNEARGNMLDQIIWNKLIQLLTTRKIQFNVPPNVFEGRDKGDKFLKKGGGFLIMAAMMKGMMMKMALGKIALIAGKALLIGKIALIISLIISLKKFLGSGGGGHPEVIYTSSSEHGSSGWQRNLRLDPYGEESGSELAYNAYRTPKL